MSSIIEVKNLTKSYTISHEGRESYTALRDIMARNAKKLFSFPKSLRSGPAVTKEEFFALNDVSFDIEEGDRVGIIGRNGAGKSTLLKILSRITEPTSGSIRINGRIAALLEVGTGFHPELSGRENIFLNGAILGMSRAEIRKHFDAIVDFAEVEKFLDTPVKRYSSGMYVRLAFAVAAHLEPEILIVDEVLAVGDAQFQKKCLGKMQEVSKNEGRTVLFVSHNTGVISNLCNKSIWLNSGTTMDTGETSIILRKYIDFLGRNNQTSYTSAAKKQNTISEIIIQNKDDETTNAFLFSDPFKIRIRSTLLKNSSEIKVGVAVLNQMKQKLFTSHFRLIELEDTNDEHEYSFQCVIPGRVLAPGNFSLDVALFSGSTTVFDYKKDVCPFEIVDSGFDLSGYSDYGFFNVDCLWSQPETYEI